MLFTEKEMKAFKLFKGDLSEFKKSITELNEHDKIIRIVCAELSIPEENLQKETRKRKYAFSRQIVHWALTYYSFISFTKIGKDVGNKDHATVLHSYKTIDDLIDTNKPIRELIEALEKRFNEDGILRKFDRGEKRYSRW